MGRSDRHPVCGTKHLALSSDQRFAPAGGQISDGAWVIAIRQKDVRPDQLARSVLDATGGTLRSGTGITP